jgi:hypothetical protein
MFDRLNAFGEYAESIFTPLDDISSILSTKFDSRLYLDVLSVFSQCSC